MTYEELQDAYPSVNIVEMDLSEVKGLKGLCVDDNIAIRKDIRTQTEKTCVLAEELGFVGAIALLVLYAALIIVCVRIARSCGDLFGMVIVMCVVGMWMFQILENIGMDIGLMPITGIPLPFVSYGSSFMVVNFALLGIIGSVWSHGAASGKKDGYATTH